MLQKVNYLPGEGGQGGRRLKGGELILYAGAGGRKASSEAAVADGGGKRPSRGRCERL